MPNNYNYKIIQRRERARARMRRLRERRRLEALDAVEDNLIYEDPLQVERDQANETLQTDMRAMDVDAKKLLYLIEARSPIYSYKEKDHTNKLVLEKLWDEIATEMNCSASECKTKWTNLRNSYTRFLREDKTKTGKQRKKWYLADAMSFVKYFINQHRSASISLDSQDVDDIKDETSEVDDPLATVNESAQSYTSNARDSPVPAKKSRTSVTELVAGPMIEFLQSRTREKPPESANSLFFKSLLADYERLSSRSQRSFRLHMLNKMNELQEEEEHDTINEPTVLPAEPMILNDDNYNVKEEFSISVNCD